MSLGTDFKKEVHSPNPLPSQVTIVLVEWRSVRKNSLIGYATVRIRLRELELELIINDCPVHTSHGSTWATLPGRPQVDKAGLPIRNEKGRQKYQPFAKWSNRAVTDRFSEAVVRAVIHAHGPAALDGDT